MTELKEFDVHVSQEAQRMLDMHTAFLDQVSLESADRLIVTYAESVTSLKTLPERCPWYEGANVPRNLYRYLLFEERYALIFQVEERTVYVDYVIDCRQDYGWLFR